MSRLILLLVKRLGLQKGLKKATELGIPHKEVVETVRQARVQQASRNFGGTGKVSKSPRVSREDWEKMYGKKYRGQRYGDVEVGQARKPAWGKELDRRIDRQEGLTDHQKLDIHRKYEKEMKRFPYGRVYPGARKKSKMQRDWDKFMKAQEERYGSMEENQALDAMRRMG
jgi:hypothetical protein